MNENEIDLENLMDKYSDMIYKIALGYLKNTDDADDMVQDVFTNYIKFIKSNHKFNDEEHEKCWLIRVTINLCCNELKAFKNKRNTILPEAFFMELDFTEDEICLLDMVDKLDKKYRIVFELHYFRDLKISEISKVLQISEDSVKTRLKRARDKLKKYMQLGGKEFYGRF